jgi:hypothetical protein
MRDQLLEHGTPVADPGPADSVRGTGPIAVGVRPLHDPKVPIDAGEAVGRFHHKGQRTEPEILRAYALRNIQDEARSRRCCACELLEMDSGAA